MTTSVACSSFTRTCVRVSHERTSARVSLVGVSLRFFRADLARCRDRMIPGSYSRILEPTPPLKLCIQLERSWSGTWGGSCAWLGTRHLACAIERPAYLADSGKLQLIGSEQASYWETDIESDEWVTRRIAGVSHIPRVLLVVLLSYQ